MAVDPVKQAQPEKQPNEPMRRRQHRLRIVIKGLRLCLLLLFASVFMLSATKLGVIFYEDWKADLLLRELGQQMEQTQEPTQPTQPTQPPQTDPLTEPTLPPEPTEPVILKRFQSIYQENPDLIGWVSIADTPINYPVMHTPQEEQYYLRRDFYGEDSRRGTPFLAGACHEGCGNYIVYGHNMGDDSMFSPLMGYEDEEFWQDHPIIRFDTLHEAGTYEIMSVFISRVFQQNETDVFRYYFYNDLTQEDVFREYVDQVQSLSLYDTGVTAEFGDQLLTLITCTLVNYDQRLVIVAKQVQP